MTYLLIIAILLFPSWCLAGVNIDWYDSPATAPTGYLINQNWEALGADNEETWITTGNPNYNGANVLRGSQSLELDWTAGVKTAGTNLSIAEGHLYGHFMMSISDIPGSSVYLFRIYNDAAQTEQIASIKYGSSVGFVIGLGSYTDSGLYTLSSLDVVHVWFDIDAVNQTASLWAGTTTTRPATKIADLAIGNNIDTSMVNLTFYGVSYSVGTSYIDQIVINNTPFTTVDP